jgi:toxin ParE1/3/4
MANYRISKDAKADLNRIYQRGVREYGEALADQYYDAFF